MSYKIFLKTFNEEKNKETYINKKYVQNIKIKETFSLKKQNILFKLWHNTNDIVKYNKTQKILYNKLIV
ncbi:hypothetical protein PFUGPA_03490 [Plasmodium falciparum Palo Alto/Uganda]|uniref:Uncharacterized protein n=1 Tax=Plasmodium falciparum (isolate Palo Alto / Uganda) TaxID=57270 RepID=W4IXY5_PLAFP|nr:hypothetical protein PFUGPA_03490 [Plasmodium falciparum Palo Alto/Uganda]